MTEIDSPRLNSSSTQDFSNTDLASCHVVKDRESARNVQLSDDKSREDLKADDIQSATDTNLIETCPKDSTSKLGRRLKSTWFMERLAFTRTKGLRELLSEDKESREHLRKEQETKEIKGKREAAHKAIEEQRRTDKEQAKRYIKEKKKRAAEEKRNSLKWGGIVRGFDPNAGLLRSSASEEVLRGPSSRARHENFPRQSESLTDILNPKLTSGQTWGSHHGGPKKNARYAQSSSSVANNDVNDA